MLGQPPLGPDRVGQRPHHPIPVAGLDARGLEDQVTAGDDPAYPRLVLIDDGERDDVQPEDPQPAQLAIAASVTIILDLDVMRPSRRRTSLLRTSASGRLGLASSPGWPIDVRPGPLTGPRAPPCREQAHYDPECRARGLSGSRVRYGLSRQLVGWRDRVRELQGPGHRDLLRLREHRQQRRGLRPVRSTLLAAQGGSRGQHRTHLGRAQPFSRATVTSCRVCPAGLTGKHRGA